MRLTFALLTGLLFAPLDLAFAADPPTNEPRPTPLTRPEMKQLIEDMKARKPRIPLPELTEEDKKKLGDRGQGYEARLRYHYMPGGNEGTGMRGMGGSGFSFGRGVVSSDLSPCSELSGSRLGNASVGAGTLLKLGGDSAGERVSLDVSGLRTRLSQ